MTETLPNGYSFDSTQFEVSNKHQNDKWFLKLFEYWRAIDKSILNIEWVKNNLLSND